MLKHEIDESGTAYSTLTFHFNIDPHDHESTSIDDSGAIQSAVPTRGGVQNTSRLPISSDPVPWAHCGSIRRPGVRTGAFPPNIMVLESEISLI